MRLQRSRTVNVRLTAFEAMLLDMLAHLEWSRGQVIRELLHQAYRSRLLLSEAQKAKLAREFIVRRRAPKRRAGFDVVEVGDRGLFGRQLPALAT